mmetsp:Transcript_26177/g.52412  ORF Transcript_26177/g.52412 Transcript_26177/m.52412 type:complete len:303 (+) Transcript_26177:252-1160(+)
MHEHFVQAFVHLVLEKQQRAGHELGDGQVAVLVRVQCAEAFLSQHRVLDAHLSEKQMELGLRQAAVAVCVQALEDLDNLEGSAHGQLGRDVEEQDAVYLRLPANVHHRLELLGRDVGQPSLVGAEPLVALALLHRRPARLLVRQHGLAQSLGLWRGLHILPVRAALVQALPCQRLDNVAHEGVLAGQELVEDAADGPDVALGPEVPGPDLRGHGHRRAAHGPARGVRDGEHLRDAEVDDHREWALEVRVFLQEHDVLVLQVLVDEPEAVAICHPVGDLPDHGSDPVLLQALLLGLPLDNDLL